MENQVIEELLDSLAERYIPEGTHKYLYVNSREVWKEIMIALIESKSIKMKLSLLTRCAVAWEAFLVQRLSIQN